MAAAAERYVTIGMAEELLRLSDTRVAQLRNQDPRFPPHAVEIHEQRLIRRGWREEAITAYRRGKEHDGAEPPQRYLGYSLISEHLGVTAERVRQLEASDPRFPAVAVELVGPRRARRRQTIHRAGVRRTSTPTSPPGRRHPPGRPSGVEACSPSLAHVR
jgi:hypothetical protein